MHLRKYMLLTLSALMIASPVSAFDGGEVDEEIIEVNNDTAVLEEEIPEETRFEDAVVVEEVAEDDETFNELEQESVFETDEITMEEVVINPEYEDIDYPGSTEAESAPIISGGRKNIKLLASPITYYSDVNEAGAALADQMSQWNPNPQVYVDFSADDYSSWTAAARAVVNSAFTHTGVPNEGDFLKAQFYSWTCKMYPVGNGGYKGRIYYTFRYMTTPEQEAVLTQEIDELLEELNLDQCSSDIEKITAIYNWFVQNITYDYENLNDKTYILKHSAYAALHNRTAVCQGIAALMYRVCLTAGFDCRYISGSNHTWNIVKIGDYYYYIDATWDLGMHPSGYGYFLKSEEDFFSHTFSSEYTTDEFRAAYPIGPETLSYPESMKYPVEAIVFASDTKDVYDVSEGTIKIFAGTYPISAYSGDVDMAITSNTTGSGTYSKGHNSRYGDYVSITPKHAGSFTVKAWNGDVETVKTFTVTQNIALESITVSPDALEMNVNEGVELSIDFTPADATNQNVTIVSSDETVAIVDGRVVRAIGAGQASITVTPEETGEAVVIPVTVIDPTAVSEDVSSITFNVNSEAKVRAVAEAEDQYFAGWAEEKDGDIIIPGGTPFIVSEPTTLYAKWSDAPESNYLDVNARVNGKYSGNVKNIAKFDVYVDGQLVKSDATDFYKKYEYGTEYEVKVTEVADGWVLLGTSSKKSYAGCIPTETMHGYIANGGINDVVLNFVSEDSLTAQNPWWGNSLDEEAYIDVHPAEGESIFVDAVLPNTNTDGFAGWSLENGHEDIYIKAGEMSSVAEEQRLYPVWKGTYALDINARINGKYSGSTKNVATFDLYIDNKLVRRGVTDYYKKLPYGVSYEVRNIDVAEGYTYSGVTGKKSYSGCIPALSEKGIIVPDGVNDVSLGFISQ